MRRICLLLAAAAAMPVPAHAQPSGPAPIAQSQRAARLEALGKAGDRGEAATLARAMAAEADADVRLLLGARLAAMRLDGAAMADPKLRRLAEAAAAPELKREALAILAASAFASGDYAQTVRLGTELEALQRAAGQSEAAEATAAARRVAAMLEGEPRQSVQGGVRAGSSPARRDPGGLMRVDLRINDQAQDAVFDTGANLSVLSASAARRLGVRMIEGDASVGNSVQGNVAVRLAVAERLEIAGNVLRNVAFLVIDDAALTFGEGGRYTIPAILGFPVMQALGRFRMEPGRFTVEPGAATATAGDGHNLHAWANELFVDVEVGGFAVPLHLDSGATTSHLKPFFAQTHPRPFAGLPREQRRSAGAGGTATGEAVRWRDVGVSIAGRSFRAPQIWVAMPSAGVKQSPYYGTLGADVLGMFASYTIDLRRMRLELGAPRR